MTLSAPAGPTAVAPAASDGSVALRSTTLGVDLYWIPLGAGADVVRISGRTFEALAALIHRRPQQALFHSAIVAVTADGSFAIEMAPIPDARGPQDRGVVSEGPVGASWAGRFRIFRYEIRRWQNGVIPDLPFAVASPVHLTSDPAVAQQILDLVPSVPTPTWGRNELHTTDMWNSNSVVSWLLVRSGMDPEAGHLPAGGRAPGWDAGVVTARRDIN